VWGKAPQIKKYKPREGSQGRERPLQNKYRVNLQQKETISARNELTLREGTAPAKQPAPASNRKSLIYKKLSYLGKKRQKKA
jgi:hypothetical protein